MKKITLALALAFAGLPAIALAQGEADPDRLAAFIDTIRDNDCAFATTYEGTAPLRAAGFNGPEITQLRRALVESGQATNENDMVTLSPDVCG